MLVLNLKMKEAIVHTPGKYMRVIKQVCCSDHTYTHTRTHTHAYTCTHTLIYTHSLSPRNGKEQQFRVFDYYTRNRGQPWRDDFYNGEDSITAAVGKEEDGYTYSNWRRPLKTGIYLLIKYLAY